MTFLLQKTLSPKKRVRHALTTLFGIGSYRANQICDQIGIGEVYQVQQLSTSQIDQLTRILTNYYYTESELVRAISQDVQRLVAIGCYKGFRHVSGLPLRGQRTHTNARTARRRRSFVK
jgi:small subunit ribosomal protein S13